MNPHVRVFPLAIRLDPDGTEWTHFIGLMEHTRASRELPAPLWGRLEPIIECLRASGVRKLLYQGPDTPLPSDVTPDARETLALAAWWMEWDHRVAVAHGSVWTCPDCGHKTAPGRDHCADPSCPSWNKLHLATGEPRLHLVPDRTSGAA